MMREHSSYTLRRLNVTLDHYQTRMVDNGVWQRVPNSPRNEILTAASELLHELSKRIGTEQQYRDLGTALGLYFWEIDRIRTDHIFSIQQSSFQMLLFWYQDQITQQLDDTELALDLEEHLKAIFQECCIVWPIT